MIYTLTVNPSVDLQYRVTDISEGTVLRAAHTTLEPGGKGFNVSRALTKLGIDNFALGFAGGITGDFLSEKLEEFGVKTDLIQVQGRSRINTSLVTENYDQYIKVNESGPTISSSELESIKNKISELNQSGDWWVFSGSLAPGIDDGFYGWMIRQLSEMGSQTALDSSGNALRQGTRAGVNLIKPNKKELEDLIGKRIQGRASILAALHEAHNLGARCILLSMAENGAYFSDTQGVWYGRPQPIQEHSAIGAGDALLAGFLAEFIKTNDPETALGFGIACGTVSSWLDGTNFGDRTQVEQIMANTMVQKI
jgi:1-phosphofructokinase family hexose kinase